MKPPPRAGEARGGGGFEERELAGGDRQVLELGDRQVGEGGAERGAEARGRGVAEAVKGVQEALAGRGELPSEEVEREVEGAGQGAARVGLVVGRERVPGLPEAGEETVDGVAGAQVAGGEVDGEGQEAQGVDQSLAGVDRDRVKRGAHPLGQLVERGGLVEGLELELPPVGVGSQPLEASCDDEGAARKGFGDAGGQASSVPRVDVLEVEQPAGLEEVLAQALGKTGRAERKHEGLGQLLQESLRCRQRRRRVEDEAAIAAWKALLVKMSEAVGEVGLADSAHALDRNRREASRRQEAYGQLGELRLAADEDTRDAGPGRRRRGWLDPPSEAAVDGAGIEAVVVVPVATAAPAAGPEVGAEGGGVGA